MKINEQDARLLFSLQAELDSIGLQVSLAELLANFREKKKVTNPVLLFAFEQAQVAAPTWFMLRFAEAILVLDSAYFKVFKKRLVEKEGREYKSQHLELIHVMKLRDEFVAHRMRNLNSTAWDEARKHFSDVYTLLKSTIELFRKVLDTLELNGIYDDVPNLSARLATTRPFTTADIEKVITATHEPDR